MVKIKPKYGKPANVNFTTWYCKNFNILTTSKDREKCIKKHIKKLKQYGFLKSENTFTEYDVIAMDFCKNPFKD